MTSRCWRVGGGDGFEVLTSWRCRRVGGIDGFKRAMLFNSITTLSNKTHTKKKGIVRRSKVQKTHQISRSDEGENHFL